MSESISLTWNEAAPFIVMFVGIILLGTGAIWQLTRQQAYRRAQFHEMLKSKPDCEGKL